MESRIFESYGRGNHEPFVGRNQRGCGGRDNHGILNMCVDHGNRVLFNRCGSYGCESRDIFNRRGNSNFESCNPADRRGNYKFEFCSSARGERNFRDKTSEVLGVPVRKGRSVGDEPSEGLGAPARKECNF